MLFNSYYHVCIFVLDGPLEWSQKFDGLRLSLCKEITLCSLQYLDYRYKNVTSLEEEIYHAIVSVCDGCN